MLVTFASGVAALALLGASPSQLAEAPASTDAATGETGVPEAPVEPVDAADPAATQIAVPKMTPVVIEILEPLGSKTSKSLQAFQIRLAEPIVVEGTEVVPAGATGMGEVVHAKKAGGMGTAGELVLAARWIEHDGQRIALRSMKLDGGESGKSQVGTVNAINVASAASLVPISIIGFFISGGNVEVPAGTLASARIGAEIEITLQPTASPDEPSANPAVAADDKLPEESTTEGPLE